ncbi:MAG: branched-chain amino acid transaminase [Ignavibacteria bacterium]|nr:branched-chain amino acid transaminase [Ignavibacteria bacterium]MBL7990767.1 branched-chain amino acid transaminase [Candidatus Kapabacteria bacterium]
MKLPTSGWIWMNGEFVQWQDAKIHVLSHVVHYGTSWFEGIRAYETKRGTAIFRLPEHIKRLERSMKIYHTEMPYSAHEIEEVCKETLRRNDLKSAYLRPVVWRGYGEMGISPLPCPVEVSVAAWELGAYLGEAAERGANVCISSWNRLPPNTMPAIAKAGGNYMNAQLMKMEAIRNGYDEALTLDIYGNVSEASGANVFVVYDGVLYTPPIGDSLLLGITRDTILTLAKDLLIEVRETLIPRGMIHVADEIFLAGTAVEINWVKSVDKQLVGNGTQGEITRKLKSRMADITTDGLDPYKWLSFVE